MSASDLPDIGHHDATHMAKVLVQYMDSAQAIRDRLSEDYHNPPTISTIRRLRKEHLESLLKPAEAPHKPHEGYYPAEHSERMAERSKRFVAALERERALSADVARSMGALDSPSLRQPAIVDQAWEREIAAARKLHGESGR